MKKRANPTAMEIKTLHNDLSTLKRQMDEVLLLLGGSASMDYKGLRTDVREMKSEILSIKEDIEAIKQEDEERFSINLKTVPQKIIAAIALLALILPVIQGIKSLLE